MRLIKFNWNPSNVYTQHSHRENLENYRIIVTKCSYAITHLFVSKIVYVEDGMDWRDPSFLEALTAETCILQKRVEACKSHVLLVTCFDSCPQQSTEINIT